MKVYTKKLAGNSFICNLFAWFFLILVFAGCLLSTIDIFKNFTATFENIAMILFTFGFVTVFLYLLLCPKKYEVCLVAKNPETYNNKKITSMLFVVVDTSLKGTLKKTMECYTIGDNPLEVGKNYTATIKRFDGLVHQIN